MSCASYNYNITAGCSFLTYLNVQNSDGSYVNTSGFSARALVISQFSDTGIIYNLNPQLIQPQVSGLIMFSGSAISTQNLPVGSFFYDCELYNGDFSIKVLNGDFNISPSTSFPI